MRIVCPDCQAVYEVPASRLGGRARKLRCARCQLEWVPSESEPAEPEPPPPLRAVPPPLPEPFDPRLPDPLLDVEARFSRHDLPRDSPRGSALPAVLALGVSVLILAGAAACAYVWRSDIMALWPPSQRLFALLGLA